MDKVENNILVRILDSLVVEDDKSKENVEERIPEYRNTPLEYVDKLKTKVNLMFNVESLLPGDLVIWKEGLKNKRVPDYDQPSIVIKNLSPAYPSKDNPAEILDIQIGLLTDEDDFVVFNFDSKRFKKFLI